MRIIKDVSRALGCLVIIFGGDVVFYGTIGMVLRWLWREILKT